MLKEKIKQKITTPALRDDLLAKVDAGYERFRQPVVSTESRPAAQTAEQPLTAPNEMYVDSHERRIISQADDAAAGATYTASPSEFGQPRVNPENRPAAQTPEQPAAAPQTRTTSSQTGTPRLDRVDHGTGRLGGFARQQITDEVVASIKAAQTPQELNVLKEKIKQKITTPALRNDLLAKVDSRLEQLK